MMIIVWGLTTIRKIGVVMNDGFVIVNNISRQSRLENQCDNDKQFNTDYVSSTSSGAHCSSVVFRIKAHRTSFISTLDALSCQTTDAPAGRRLIFILQRCISFFTLAAFCVVINVLNALLLVLRTSCTILSVALAYLI